MPAVYINCTREGGVFGLLMTSTLEIYSDRAMTDLVGRGTAGPTENNLDMVTRVLRSTEERGFLINQAQADQIKETLVLDLSAFSPTNTTVQRVAGIALMML